MFRRNPWRLYFRRPRADGGHRRIEVRLFPPRLSVEDWPQTSINFQWKTKGFACGFFWLWRWRGDGEYPNDSGDKFM